MIKLLFQLWSKLAMILTVGIVFNMKKKNSPTLELMIYCSGLLKNVLKNGSHVNKWVSHRRLLSKGNDERLLLSEELGAGTWPHHLTLNTWKLCNGGSFEECNDQKTKKKNKMCGRSQEHSSSLSETLDTSFARPGPVAFNLNDIKCRFRDGFLGSNWQLATRLSHKIHYFNWLVDIISNVWIVDWIPWKLGRQFELNLSLGLYLF